MQVRRQQAALKQKGVLDSRTSSRALRRSRSGSDGNVRRA